MSLQKYIIDGVRDAIVKVLQETTDWRGNIFSNWAFNKQVQPRVVATVFASYEAMLVMLLRDTGIPASAIGKDSYSGLKESIETIPDDPEAYKDGFYYIFVVGDYGVCVQVESVIKMPESVEETTEVTEATKVTEATEATKVTEVTEANGDEIPELEEKEKEPIA